MKKRSTKQVLTISVVYLFVFVAMLIGTTYAWFTDGVTSGVNQIIAGNLDVDVVTEDGVSITDKATLFNDILWEPGAVAYENLTVKNLGTVAFKYNLNVSFANENTVNGYGLSTALEVGVVEGGVKSLIREGAVNEVTNWTILADFKKTGHILAGSSDVYGIVIRWNPNDDNNNWNVNNGKVTSDGEDYLHIDLGVNLLATQYTYEEDSFDDQYDAMAPLPGDFYITNNTELRYAMSAGGTGIVENDIENANAETKNGVTLDLNLGGHSIKNEVGKSIINNGTLSLKNGAITSADSRAMENYGNLYVDGVEFRTTGKLYGFHNLSGNTVLDNTVIYGQRGGLNIQGGNVTFNSLTVTMEGISGANGHIVYIYGQDSKLTINGGTFTHLNKANKRGAVIYADEGADVVVNGGTFHKGGSHANYVNKWIQALNGATVTIYGGKFEFDPSAFVAEGYEAIKGTDNWWTVSKIA